MTGAPVERPPLGPVELEGALTLLAWAGPAVADGAAALAQLGVDVPAPSAEGEP